MEIECCIRGHHVYIDVWDASIGEELDCHRDGHVQQPRSPVQLPSKEPITTQAQQDLAALRYPTTKLSCSAAEPSQLVSTQRQKTRVRSVP